jgi:signal transduction histidine kinase
MSVASLPTSTSASVVHESAERLDPADMRDLLRSFTQTTHALEATHNALHRQVARLQQELADANAALRRSESLAALGQMAAGIAHEVRNPLGSIQLYAQMLGEDLADRPEQSELCGKINRAVIGLDAIVRDVLTFARDMKVRIESIGSEDLIDRAMAACDGLVATHRVRVRRHCGRERILSVDPGLVVQALSNVIRNAVEAMVEHESPVRELAIRVTTPPPQRAGSVRRKCDMVVIAVQDSGPGIPAEVQDRIFNPFFTTRHTGTGLGLAIVHRIVDAHGGQVAIRNVPSSGACVELCLPACPTEARSVSHEIRPPSDERGLPTVTIPPRHFAEQAR